MTWNGGWKEAGGPEVLQRRRRLKATGASSKRCGVDPRPTIHIGKVPATSGGARLRSTKQHGCEACDGAFLKLGVLDPGLSLLQPVLRRRQRLEVTGVEDGGRRDLEGLGSYFSFGWVLCVLFQVSSLSGPFQRPRLL